MSKPPLVTEKQTRSSPVLHHSTRSTRYVVAKSELSAAQPGELNLEQGSSAAVMVPACGNLDLGVGDPVDQPMLLGDTPGPVAGELVSQRLRFAQSLVSVASDVPDQGVDPLQGPTAPGLPPEVVLPRLVGPADPHLSGRRGGRAGCRRSCRAAPWRWSAWALAGERSRQAVSRRDWYSSSETITTGSCPARVMTIS